MAALRKIGTAVEEAAPGPTLDQFSAASGFRAFDAAGNRLCALTLREP